MKHILIVLIFSGCILMACKKDNAITTSDIPAMEMVDTTGTGGNTLKYSGTLNNGPYGSSVMGKISIYENAGKYTLVLDSFRVNNGPDLHVYLSQEEQPVNFIDLGKLRSVSGTQVYNIPGTPDFLQFKFGLIHCQQFDHLFGKASLQ